VALSAASRQPIQGSEGAFLIGSEHMKRRMHSNFGFVAAGLCATFFIHWHNAVASEHARLSGYTIQNERCGAALRSGAPIHARVLLSPQTLVVMGAAMQKGHAQQLLQNPFPKYSRQHLEIPRIRL
jgi:hypothetical protein